MSNGADEENKLKALEAAVAASRDVAHQLRIANDLLSKFGEGLQKRVADIEERMLQLELWNERLRRDCEDLSRTVRTHSHH